MSNTPRPVKLFNTASQELEDLIPISGNEVKVYCCGPTVYFYSHVGNYRTYVAWDVLVKTLRQVGYDVKHVMNITDVGHLTSDADEGEDKMDVAAKREGKSALEISSFYTDIFFKHAGMLNIIRPNIVAKATEHIPEMIEMIQTLERKGYAYVANNGNVYFDTAKFADYGKMARLDIENLRHGARVEEDAHKKSPTDFVLWFVTSKFGAQEQRWDSPWGVGYPGWHIECSAMSVKYLGEQIDIHCGGEDHINIHHTNEIAQSEAYLGHKWVNFWLHTKFMLLKDMKISKSKGDVMTPETLSEWGFNPLAFRHLVLTSNFRKQVTLSKESLESSQNFLNKLYGKVEEYKKAYEASGNGAESNTSGRAKEVLDKFYEVLCRDLGTAQALACLNGVFKDKELSDASKYLVIQEMDKILGLLPA